MACGSVKMSRYAIIVVAGRMLFCLCVTTNLVDIDKLNTLGQVSCFILVCCLGRDKQLSVKMLCGCLVMSTKYVCTYERTCTVCFVDMTKQPHSMKLYISCCTNIMFFTDSC